MDPATLAPDQIKLTAGLLGAVTSNLTGIPFDQFRALVAQDLQMTKPLGVHFQSTFSSITKAFTGATARITQKSAATAMNLYVPPDLRESNPFTAAFCLGMFSAPILNVPRILQLNKVDGNPYPVTAKNFFGSSSGLIKYGQNTGMWAPGEGLRMMLCFGTKDYLMPLFGGKEDPRNVCIPLHCLKMVSIVSPIVSSVETIFAVTTETLTTVHAKTTADPKFKGVPFGQVLKETVTPSYAGRCFTSLLIKNLVANSPLFWVMFMADFYTKKSKILRGEIKA